MTDNHRKRNRAIGLAMLSLVILIGGIATLMTRAAVTPKDAPYGIPARVPWTTSRVAGSPEPPPPYQTVRAFPKLQFNKPLDIIYSPAGDRVFVAEQAGKIFTFANDESVAKADLMIDVKNQPGLDKLPGWKSVQLYGITPHPQFDKNHFFYAAYALDFPGQGRNHENGSRLSRFTVSETNPPTIDPKSEVILLEWLGGGHNGGCIKFGPDGMLYLSTGDGGDPDPPDPFFAGQNVGQLLCCILRLDVDHPSLGKHYSIPAANPFVKTPGARGEVFAYGLRNPWRMNFDTQTGNLWVGDVGWELYESIFCAKPGTNCGWSVMEGPNPVHPDGKRGPTPIRPPDATVSHAESASITGGVVYRGKKLPELTGNYIFGDWQTRRLWAAKCNGDTLEPWREIAQTDQRIVSFADQPDGETIIVDHDGGLYHLARNDVADAMKHPFPRKLSETGLFISTKDQTPQSGVVPFEANAAQWVDGATAQRWIAVPGTEKVGWGKGVWGDTVVGWPKGSVLVRTLSLGTAPSNPPTTRRVETQLMHHDGKQWRFYTYAWNDEQTDADLVPAGGDEKAIPIVETFTITGVRQQKWHFPSRTQCATCHNPWCDYTLAFNPGQLDRTVNFGSVSDNQIRAFKHVGLLPGPKPGEKPADAPAPGTPKLALADPYDASADVNERARSYLHVNCSHCHRFGGGGSALFDVRKELPNDRLKLIDEKPGLGSFGIDDARLIAAGDPARSVLLFRMAKVGRGRMPHIGSDRVDERGADLVRQWAAGMEPPKTPSPDPGVAQAQDDRKLQLRALADPAGKPADLAATADKLLSTTGGAMAVLCEMLAGKVPPAAVQVVAPKGYASPQESIRDLFRRFDPAEANSNRLGSTINTAKLLAMPGDAARGRQVFIGPAGAAFCSRCHIVGGQGTDFGPDLSHVASKYKKPELLDNILNPSKTIAQGYATFLVQTKDGESVSGFLVSKTEQEVVLKDAQQKQVHLPAASVKKMRTETLSAMPEGLLGDLEPQQAADLLEFLTTLK